ncbi:hypothetical protein B0H10DRAFT_869239 [Mycena sp. CBHHK59/15]|nr:hypothetical protein B0H10DRAFT_869239 [Mycena sp. CBHHK59/15]
MFGPLEGLGINTNDVRMACDKSWAGGSCYAATGWMSACMNSARVRAAIGACSRTSTRRCSTRSWRAARARTRRSGCSRRSLLPACACACSCLPGTPVRPT